MNKTKNQNREKKYNKTIIKKKQKYIYIFYKCLFF